MTSCSELDIWSSYRIASLSPLKKIALVVCEYWNSAEARWGLVDPQFDEVWREKLTIEHDILDLPRDRFVMASDAWVQCRVGEADPSKFGIFQGDLRGLWFMAGEIVRDVAALNKMEMLPWDIWGAIPHPNELLNDEQLAFFDRLAALTRSPDASFTEVRTLYEGDDRLHVPATVFNGVLNCLETIWHDTPTRFVSPPEDRFCQPVALI